MVAASAGDRRLAWLRRWPILLAIVLVLIGVAGFVGPYSFAKPDNSDSQRHDIASRAKDFAVTMNTFDVDDLDGYQKRMKSLLTKSYRKEFSQATGMLFPELKKTQLSSTDPKVLSVAIKSVGSNSASALVAVDAKTVTSDDKDEKASSTRHFRWKLTFKKVSGEWLVDNLTSIPSMDAELDQSGQSESGQSDDGNGSDEGDDE